MGKINNSNGNFILGTYIVFTTIFLLAFGPFLGLARISTYVLIPLLFLISLFRDLPFLSKNKVELKLLMSFFLISILSVFNYVSMEELIKGFSGLLGAILAAYIPLALNNKKDFFKYFHFGYILGILSLIAIMYINENFNFTDFATKVDYRDRFLLNANQYSYISYFANFSLFYIHQRYKNKISTIFLLVLPIIFLIICFVTQSRAGLLLIILINVIYWVFIVKLRSKYKIARDLRIVVIFIVFALASIKFYDIYSNSRIKNRVEDTGTKTDSRELLIYDSLEAFYQNPILGVGLGQVVFYTRYRLFSHNSYVEAVAEHGIIGGFLLFFLYGIPFKKCILMYRSDKKNTIIKINLLFFLTFYFYNNFYVFYKFPFSMMYFFLVISIQYKILAEQEFYLHKYDTQK